MVIELDLPAPFDLIVGMPPALQDAGLAAWQENDPANICLGRPTIFECDRAAVPDQVAHWPRLSTSEACTLRHDSPCHVSDRDVEFSRSSMHQEAAVHVRSVDPRTSEE